MTPGTPFAALDVGSNAIRLLFARAFRNGDAVVTVKESMIRMPLRLGEDVFRDGRIGDRTAERLLDTMRAFALLVRAYGPAACRACATSAMRQAANGEELAAAIRRESGLELELIDGTEEAKILYANHLSVLLPEGQAALFVDVGGGSTEITVIRDHVVLAQRSFAIGSVRLLNGRVPDEEWDELRHWLKTRARPHGPLQAVGSGGNINKIFNLTGLKKGQPVSYPLIKHVALTIEPYGMEERIRLLGLRPDRADVILPAARIYLAVMKWSRAQLMHVPQVGLADGLVQEMARAHLPG
ncbi:MAG TPA: exopolyphosphatase [Candidatus Krumholzibacteria bacterium]|nr:exopolyphosphatase [Candidatus Krumholzibacteria bacterium]HRX51171.1 exopolyphosphatase [Candidatus Krumholzibacteria bacterium]